MTELAAILAAREPERAASRPCVLATVVGTEGSTYRRPGARMLVGTEGTRLAGSISGGCLEGDLLAAAWQRTAPGLPAALVHYDTRRDADALFGHGTGCRGRVSVLLERLEPGTSPDTLDRLGATVLRDRRPAVLAHVLGKGPARGQHLLHPGAPVGAAADTFPDRATADRVRAAAAAAWRAGRSAWEDVPGVGVVFLEHVAPPPSLTLYGTGPDAAFILRLGQLQGWHVAVGGPRAAGAEAALAGADRLVFGSPARLAAELLPEPGGAVVLMTHSYLADLILLERLVHAPIRYLGILGPHARRERLLADLARQGAMPPAADLERILHAPAGLDLGTDGPEGIALAVVAEIQAVLAQGRCAGHLRDRSGPLHAPVDAGFPRAPLPDDPGSPPPEPPVACALSSFPGSS